MIIRIELYGVQMAYIVDNGLHIDRVSAAHFELIAEAISSSCVAHGEVLVAPLVSQDLGQDVVVGNHGDTIVRVVRSHD